MPHHNRADRVAELVNELRHERLRFFAETIEAHFGLEASIKELIFGWIPGSESGLPLPTATTIYCADGERYDYEEAAPGLADMGSLHDLPIWSDLLAVLEEDFDPDDLPDGGVITLIIPQEN